MPQLLHTKRMLLTGLWVWMLVGAAGTGGEARADVLAEIARLFPASPRSYAQASELLRDIDSASALLSRESLGQSHQGRDIWLATVTDPNYPSDGKIRLFIIARQHGTEYAGTTAALGLLEHLARAPAGVERELLRHFEISVVSIANPDGAVGGRRTNGKHVDLNRDWGKFSQPETRAIQAAICARRPHAVVDLHELPANSSKRSYRENFVETIGAHDSLSQILCDNTVASSRNIAHWMSKYSYPLSVYYDYPGDSLTMCHRYWGLSQGLPSFLCESKTGGARSLQQRAGFHVLAILGIINYLGRQQLGPAPVAVAIAEETPAGSPQPLCRPLQLSLRLEPHTSADGAQVVVCTEVEGEGSFGFVTVRVNGVTKALTNQRKGRYLLDADTLTLKQHHIAADICDEYGTVLASQQTTLSLPLADLQVAQ